MIPGKTYKTINKAVGKAIFQYGMIEDGDRIVVGLSGGKDSLTLMYMLNERRVRVNVDYTLFAVHIDPGFDDHISTCLQEYAEQEKFDLRVEKTNYGVLGHSSENRENPCFLCSRLRRKRLFEIAAELDCKTIALGHNKDDMIETLFLNMFYAGEISTMMPAQRLFNDQFKIIRPLVFVEEKTIVKFAKERKTPELTNPCPSAGISKRTEVKKMLEKLYKSNNKIKGNIFRSMSRVRTEYLP